MDERQRDFLVLVAYIYLRHSDAEDAVSLLEAVYISTPHDRDVIQLLAYGYLQIGKFSESLELTNYLLGGKQEETTGMIWLLHCRALQGMGKHEEARKLWKQVQQRSGRAKLFPTDNSHFEGLRSIDVSVAATSPAFR
ncbi:hypothetical protein AB1L42_01420 [Thalassoglobus sp. JC818]|uniref:type III secretion apparatus assembly chaperone SctY n=1 Tax=Thalassoglobus sp. JC818 TaxID=3232136 RepID=UPI0034574AB8